MQKKMTIIPAILAALLFCGAAFSPTAFGDMMEKDCTITQIDGPKVLTSCREFVLGEEVEIKDWSGRTIFLHQVPLPVDAAITYRCESAENCNSIISIRLFKSIKERPE